MRLANFERISGFPGRSGQREDDPGSGPGFGPGFGPGSGSGSTFDISFRADTDPQTKIAVNVFIDSAERDPIKYPDAARYIIRLNTPVRDVVSVAMTSAGMPVHSSDKIFIDERRRYVCFRDEHGAHRVRLFTEDDSPSLTGDGVPAPGERSPLNTGFSCEEVVRELDRCLSPFSVRCHERGTHLELSGGHDFELVNEGIAELLSFRCGHVAKRHRSLRKFRSDFRNRYLTLNIANLERITSNSRAVDQAFCVMPRIGHEFIIADVNNTAKKYFNPPLGQLAEFAIEIRGADGSLYDFGEHEHWMTFEVISLNAADKFRGSDNPRGPRT
ncbi:MAG: hypothetical protein ACYCOU_11205 [Sulfobacillus sp.]